MGHVLWCLVRLLRAQEHRRLEGVGVGVGESVYPAGGRRRRRRRRRRRCLSDAS